MISRPVDNQEASDLLKVLKKEFCDQMFSDGITLPFRGARAGLDVLFFESLGD